MVLARKFKTKEEIPVGLLPYGAERDGLWHLDLEDPEDKGRLSEMRTHNIALMKQVDEQNRQIGELLTRFEGIDPEQVRKLADEKRQLEEERQLKAGEVEKVIENRVKGLKADWDKQVAALTSERDTLNTRLTAIQIDQGVITAATKRGLRPTAITDITARARCVFKLVNGAPRAFEADGQTVRYGKDGHHGNDFG